MRAFAMTLGLVAGCSHYGVGMSQTSMVGRADNEAGDADLSVEQRSVEVMMFTRVGRLLGFAEGGLSAFSVRERRGDDAMEPDDLGLGDRAVLGLGYEFPRGALTVTPYGTYSVSLAQSALTGTTEEDDLLESTLYGGLGAGVEVLMDRRGVTPYLRVGVERLRGRVLDGLFAQGGGPTGTEFTTTAIVFTIGARAELSP